MEAQLRWESRAHLDHLAALGVLLALYAHALIQTLLPQQPPPGPPIAAALRYPPCQRCLLQPQSPLQCTTACLSWLSIASGLDAVFDAMVYEDVI